MTIIDHKRFFFPAWGISLILHGGFVGVAFMLATQVKPILPEDVFTWDVALVQARHDAVPVPVQPVVTPAQPMSKVVPQSRPKRVAEVSQLVPPPEQKVASLPPIEQQVEVPQVREEPFEQRVVEAEVPKTEPAVETKTFEPVAAATTSEPSESQPVQQEPAVIASAPAVASEAPISQEKTVDVVATPGLESKADNRWLAESLWRRVAELKRYPNSARMNGQEGKVVLKAIIRSDGQLAEVSVQKSSGHSVLDVAAMEAVKLACPLHMKHAIGKPLIVVSLPIVYSLAN